MRIAYIQTSKQLYISDLENQHWTKSNDCLLTLVNRRSLSPCFARRSWNAPHGFAPIHQTPSPQNAHYKCTPPPKKVYICKTAAIVPITLYFTTQNKILHILTRGKIELKKRFAHFSPFLIFRFQNAHFPVVFEACDSLKFSFFVRIVFVEVLCKKAFFHL